MKKIIYSIEDIADWKGTPLQVRLEYYDSNGEKIKYKGLASSPGATNSAIWWVKKYQWSGDIFIYKKDWSTAITWTNRDSVSWGF